MIWQLNKCYCITLASTILPRVVVNCFWYIGSCVMFICRNIAWSGAYARTHAIVTCAVLSQSVMVAVNERHRFAKSQILVRTSAMLSFSEPASLSYWDRFSVCQSVCLYARQLRVNRGLFAENIYTTCLSSETRTCRALVRLVQQTEQC